MTDPPGMDHGLYEYSALPMRPAWRWPSGESLAIAVVVYLDHWDLDADPGGVRDRRLTAGFAAYDPDYWTASIREYGARVGVFRVLEVLDRLDISATLVADPGACRHYRFVVDEAVRRGWEIAAGGLAGNHLVSSNLAEHEERSALDDAAALVSAAAGTRVRGWFGVERGESTRTPYLAAAAGYEYLCDWPNDDQPYLLATEPPLVSLPRQADWDDAELLWVRRADPVTYPATILQAAATLASEGARAARFMHLGIRPWVLGQAHHITYLDAALAPLAARRDVWFAPAGDIARAFREART